MTSTHPHYLRHCGWQVVDSDGAAAAPLQGPVHCDAVVIGAGYTGLGIARTLASLRPGADIRVLEADAVGAGSPGRNSGFMLEHALAAPSAEAAQSLYQAYRAVHHSMATLANLDQTATATVFKGAASPRGQQHLQAMARHLEASGQPCQWLDRDAVTALTGSHHYRQGLALPGSRLVNPRQLIRALVAAAPAGVTVHEHSPAMVISRERDRWLVRTPNGTAYAGQVFLANNAFAAGLGYGRAYSVKIFTYAGLTPRLPAPLFESLAPGGQWGLLPAHRLGSTFRTTEDRRLMVRGMYGYEHEGGQEVAKELMRSLTRRYPQLRSVGLEHWWGGTTSLTFNGAPLWGQLEPGLFASIGCNGVGILKGWLLGSELARLACQQPHLDVPGMLGRAAWMPPEPFRQLGFRAVSAVEKHLAGAEK
ncbi:NAD(P)/FAD-dependent oxidoreductase [Marinobacter xestospongiae]|uniref:FAD-binding oxidoreductase n=1 Tax=Marinobacter xestospongiae TaxID=994319 RepID=A0ABU3VZ50_9GAMM|nr:FAD-binding oxidoreductase [Marinobacter xestospongiae]MDV2079524.1 FAD-binding oxidoreductase [Marinobacter xestospongiae]